VFCTECGIKIPDGSKFCQSCGVSVSASAPAEPRASSANASNVLNSRTGQAPQELAKSTSFGPGAGCLVAVLLLVVVGWLGSLGDEASSPTTSGVAANLPPGARGDCRAFSREGWLVDYDRRGEVALRSTAGSPSSSQIAATVAWPKEVFGEPMITPVLAQCYVDRILYYYINFDESSKGWVDVDYLHWRRPTP
jgi:hypothetical protein